MSKYTVRYVFYLPHLNDVFLNVYFLRNYSRAGLHNFNQNKYWYCGNIYDILINIIEKQLELGIIQTMSNKAVKVLCTK